MADEPLPAGWAEGKLDDGTLFFFAKANPSEVSWQRPTVPADEWSAEPQPAAPTAVRARALYAWDEAAGAAEGDLVFQIGDEFELVSRDEPGHGWMTGVIDGVRGVFPANYIEEVAAAPGAADADAGTDATAAVDEPVEEDPVAAELEPEPEQPAPATGLPLESDAPAPAQEAAAAAAFESSPCSKDLVEQASGSPPGAGLLAAVTSPPAEQAPAEAVVEGAPGPWAADGADEPEVDLKVSVAVAAVINGAPAESPGSTPTRKAQKAASPKKSAPSGFRASPLLGESMPDASKAPAPQGKAARPKQQSGGGDKQQQRATVSPFRTTTEHEDEEKQRAAEPMDPVQAALQRANRYKSEPALEPAPLDDVEDESEPVSGGVASLRVSPIRVVNDSSGGHSVRSGPASARSDRESSLYDSDEDSEVSPATVPRLVSDIRWLAGHQEPTEMRMQSARQSQSRVQSEKKKGNGTFGGAMTGRGSSLNT